MGWKNFPLHHQDCSNFIMDCPLFGPIQCDLERVGWQLTQHRAQSSLSNRRRHVLLFSHVFMQTADQLLWLLRGYARWEQEKRNRILDMVLIRLFLRATPEGCKAQRLLETSQQSHCKYPTIVYFNNYQAESSRKRAEQWLLVCFQIQFRQLRGNQWNFTILGIKIAIKLARCSSRLLNN